MAVLILGLIVFLGVHSVQIVKPNLRARVIERAGNRGAWMWPYTAMAGIGLVFIIVGYGLARQGPPIIYTPTPALRHLALLLMIPVFPLLFATYIHGRIRQKLGHPMLIATLLWAIAHLMANGNLADLLLFGSFLVWAVIDWHSLRKRGANTPSEQTIPWGRNDAISIVAGGMVYVATVVGLHQWLFRVSPMAG